MSPETRRIRLGELLLKAGVVNEQQLHSALAEQKRWGGKLGSILVEMNFLSEDMLVKALSRQLGLDRVELEDEEISQKALEMLSPELAQEKQVLPVSFDTTKGELVIAMAEPENLELVDEISFRTGQKVRVVIAAQSELARAIRKHYFDDTLVEDSLDTNQEIDFIGPLGAHGDPNPRQVVISSSADPNRAHPESAEIRQALELIRQMEAVQLREIHVLRSMIELLVAKGIISSEEYQQKLKQ